MQHNRKIYKLLIRMKCMNFWVIIASAVLIGSISGYVSLAIAQTETNDRHFQKDFCANEVNLLSGINYTNGEELSYDSTGCPTSIKIIHRWNELSISQKNIITNQLSLNGYVDITEQLQNARQ